MSEGKKEKIINIIQRLSNERICIQEAIDEVDIICKNGECEIKRQMLNIVEDLSDFLPIEIYTQKIIEIKSNKYE